MFHVNNEVSSSQLIHTCIKPLLGEQFYCTSVYGTSEAPQREFLFKQLVDIADHMLKPWIVLGDFNCVAYFSERIERLVRLKEIQPLRQCMFEYGLKNVKYISLISMMGTAVFLVRLIGCFAMRNGKVFGLILKLVFFLREPLIMPPCFLVSSNVAKGEVASNFATIGLRKTNSFLLLRRFGVRRCMDI